MRHSSPPRHTRADPLRPASPVALFVAGVVLAASFLGTLSAPAGQSGQKAAGGAGEKPGQVEPTGGTRTPTFPIVEEIDRREKELKEQRLRQKRKHQYNDIQRLVQLAQLQEDNDERIRMLLRAEVLLHKMLAEKAEAQITKAIRHVRKTILLVPLPKAYQDRVGLQMALVRSPGSPFYASRNPVSRQTFAAFVAETGAAATVASAVTEQDGAQAVTGVTWLASTKFCTWLSVKTGTPYTLPTLPQLRQLKLQSGRGFWTSTAWDGPTQDDVKTRKRYGVQMFTILDPDKTLGRGEVPADLAFARFDTVGFFVVTPVESGASERLKRLGSEK